MTGVLAYVLHRGGEFNRNSLGAVCEGARLANALGGELAVLVVGGDELSDDLCASLGSYGAARVYRVEGPAGLAAPVIDAMAQIMRADRRGYALFGGGLLGLEIGAGLAARLNIGVTMEVTEVTLADGRPIAVRAIHDDSLAVDVGYVGQRGVIIGRVNAFDVREMGRDAAIVEDLAVKPAEWSARVRIVEHEQADADRGGEPTGTTVALDQAEVVVAGGRGLRSADDFRLCQSLARELGGAAAATRTVVDAGWHPYSGQVGQTGKTVTPRLYLAAGISGAIQHKVGMQRSQNIVAINNDPGAPIFEFCDLGIVGDLHQILPRLIEAVRARKNGQTIDR